ncbi:multidrug efflux system membrane fusion protein [Pseudoduganella flava]|uniref:Efflux RND transporter periplasmic adaptor subunit n=1 Tax=Pseudoduganella flava TaxID=871742 RepID=A0A562PH31_9BURK|nr:efflux RND transporter periplasmic adaptor subunit [Pseudoduganella flava]QGZ42497.1 efflux RND transporter periplasmic adaptor subunit [Pseudoduganella flava]TWI43643.1 multidrug efflux system membrane fusion protein [Pseudoduganella flava]
MKNTNKLTALARPIVAALAAAGLAVTLAGCEEATGKTAEAPAAGGPPISAALVIEKPITETQEFSGRLEAIDRVEIRSRVAGFITAVNFKPGSEVKKGDVLFVIDPRPYQAEADRAQAAANSARAKAELARLELTRAEKLLADKAIAQREFDERASSQKELEAAARAAQAAYESAKLNLTYTRVTAPIDGRVSKAEITLGNLVDQSAVLTSVVSLDKIYASFDGDEDTYLRVGAQNHKGQPVAVKVGLANEEGFPHEGKLEFVDNQLDTQTGSVRMRAVFENKDRMLVPGLFARVQLGGAGATTNAILINDRAVGTDQNRKFVFVIGKDNKAEYRPVKLGATVDGMRVVKEGLKPNEKIVVNGLQRVRPGAPVTPQIVPMDANVAAKADKKDAKDAKVAAL